MYPENLRTNPSTEVMIAENIRVLRQTQKLIDQISDELYLRIDPVLSPSSLGAQFRHCLDFYQCFLQGIKNSKIDYDQRERDEQIESNRSQAMARIEAIAEGLWKLSISEDQSALWVRQDSPYWSVSSLRRELQFLLSHTVHHQALIVLLLKANGFAPAEEIGVAPSTLEYRKAENVLSKLVARQPRLSALL